jgi:RimJ/RimL family protein N-acetyltransferase
VRAPRSEVLIGTVVRLEPLSVEHVPDLTAAAAYDEIWTWTGPARMDDRDAVAAYVDDAVADPGRVPFAVVVDGRAVGSSSYLDIDLSVGGIEVGHTWYTPSVWQSAVNPECKLLLLGHAFEELGAGRVTLKTDGRNARSQAAIRKLGARYDGTLRHHRRRPDGSIRDTACFSVLATEWPGVRAGLLDRIARAGRPVPPAAGR